MSSGSVRISFVLYTHVCVLTCHHVALHLPSYMPPLTHRELVSAVDYLHANLIMHGDLKPDNLLLSADGRLTISDFGSATVLVRTAVGLCWMRRASFVAASCASLLNVHRATCLLMCAPAYRGFFFLQPHEGTRMSTTMGTPAFMAPEMCGLRSTPFAPFPAEVWAVGVCLYMFVYGRGECGLCQALSAALRSFEGARRTEAPVQHAAAIIVSARRTHDMVAVSETAFFTPSLC